MTSTMSGALEIIARTDPGRVREHNEDVVFADPEGGLVILADGMGGYNAGEVASGLAVSFLASAMTTSFFYPPPADFEDGQAPSAFDAMVESIALANTAIYNASRSEPSFFGMGTTLVMALFSDDHVTVGHVGDSRLYRLREGTLTVMTRDHSLLQEQIDLGMITAEEARYAHNKNLVTRALGVEPAVEAELHEYEVWPEDVYLLCSDGLNDMLDDEVIHLALKTFSPTLELAAERLIQMANDQGGRDNVSVILIKVLRAFPGRREEIRDSKENGG